MTTSPVIESVVAQHADEAHFLWFLRETLISAPHVGLHALNRHDNRLAAHLDGLAVGREYALELHAASTADPVPGFFFTAAVIAIEAALETLREGVIARAKGSARIRRELVAAFGWVEPRHLRGIVRGLLQSPDPFRRYLGLAACAVHRVAANSAHDEALRDTDAPLAARALRMVGELGKLDAEPVCARMLESPDPTAQFWAAWSAVLLGNRGAAIEVLRDRCLEAGKQSERALRTLLQAVSSAQGHETLREIARDPARWRAVIFGCGIVGDPTYVPWLIQGMRDPVRARLAGEALSHITGLDLAQGFEVPRPLAFEEPVMRGQEPPSVSVASDEHLPWPDVDRIEAWWSANGHRFAPGERYFMGASVTREHCIEILRAANNQRQRVTAAYYLCLQQPGTGLFEWRAPGDRQRRLLATLS